MKRHTILFCQHVRIFDFIYCLPIVKQFTKLLIGFTGETKEFIVPGETCILVQEDKSVQVSNQPQEGTTIRVYNRIWNCVKGNMLVITVRK
jgi:hypothetical protein